MAKITTKKTDDLKPKSKGEEKLKVATSKDSKKEQRKTREQKTAQRDDEGKQGETKKLKETKGQNLIAKYARTKNDTGSTEMQIIGFSQRIDELAKHLKKHHGDNDSRRGILLLVGRRRRLLNYFQKNNPEKYRQLIDDLKLKK